MRSARTFVLLLLIGLCLGLSSQAQAEEIPKALAGWMHAEQMLNSREIDTSRIVALNNEQDPRYAPGSGKVFDVKTYWIDTTKAHSFFGAGLNRSLQDMFTRTVDGNTQVRLLVHPESERFYYSITRGAERGANLKASATASSRTLLVWPEGRGSEACFVKVSLDKEVGGVVRTVPKGEVARSIGINNALHADRNVLPESFQFLPEVIGIMPKGMERGGMIVREIPKDVRDGKSRLIPMFSLFVAAEGGTPPLLVEMIKASGMDPRRFVAEKITRPFAQQFMELAIRNGVVMEPHGQNLLIELGSNGQPTGRFFHRDMGGFNVNFKHRINMKRPKANTPTITTRAEDYHEQYHNDSLASALDVYFEGGFLFAAEKHMQKWQAKGTIGGARLVNGALKTDLVKEVERAHEKIVGTYLDLGGNLRRLRKVVPAARQVVSLRAPVKHKLFGKMGKLQRNRVRLRQGMDKVSESKRAKTAR